MAYFKISLKTFLDPTLDMIKHIIPLPHPQVLQAVNDALPERVLLQQHQVLLHQLDLLVLLRVQHVPQVEQQLSLIHI